MLSVSLPGAALVTWSLVRTNGCSAVTLTGRSEGRPVSVLVLRPTLSIQMSVDEVQSVTQLCGLTVWTDQKFVYHDVSSPRSPSRVSVSVAALTVTWKSMCCQKKAVEGSVACTTPLTEAANEVEDCAEP